MIRGGGQVAMTDTSLKEDPMANSLRNRADPTQKKKAANQPDAMAKKVVKAAANFAKNKKNRGWLPSRTTIIIVGLVAVLAMGYNYFLSLVCVCVCK